MVVALALTLKELRFFHLITHAVFKALLFICVGVGIHAVYGSQDLRGFGGLTQTLPWPSALMCTANLALLGFPFLAGFYSKDSILERMYNIGARTLPLVTFLLGVGLTTAYSAKIIRLVLTAPGGVAPTEASGGVGVGSVKLPLLFLGGGAVLGGAGLAADVDVLSPMLSPSDKLVPLALVATGGGLG